MIDFLILAILFSLCHKCDRWWERAEQAKNRIGWTAHLWPKVSGQL
jgi:hypothetical protein